MTYTVSGGALNSTQTKPKFVYGPADATAVPAIACLVDMILPFSYRLTQVIRKKAFSKCYCRHAILDINMAEYEN